MKSFRRNVRGQFVIIAALLISILTLSLVLSIHQINLNRQQLGYQPVQELVLGITSDLDRALAHALSDATRTYNATGNEEQARASGTAFVSKWVNSIMASYSHLGLRMNINETGEGLTDVSWNIEWSREVGISQVRAQFDLDIDAYGFKGWVGRSGKFVTLRLYANTIDITADNQSTTLQFQVLQGKDELLPVPNLTNESLYIWAYVAKATRVPATITSLTYLGGGNYSVTFTPKVFEYTLGVDMTVLTPADNIFVSTYYGKDARFLLTLKSQEDNGASLNNGTIQFGPHSYSPLPVTINDTDPATYYLEYVPENASYAFVNWTTAGSVTVQNTFSSITSITIKGNGTVTAIYRRIIPVYYNVALNSRDWENQHHNLGNITLDSVTYAPLPNYTSLLAGDYSLLYQPANESYRFLWWETTGGVALWNPYSNSTTVTITGNGNITAVYMARPPVQIPDPLLFSQEDNNATGNLGQIRLGETVFNLNNSLLTNSGIYLLEYYPNATYEFLNWTTTGLITVTNPFSNPTAVSVTGDGAIIAFYRQLAIVPPQNFSLTLNSAEWDSATTNSGSVTLNSSAYSLPASAIVTIGDHSLQYIADSSHIFLRWETTGNIIVWNSTNSNTNIRILGDGTLTAIYSHTSPTTATRTITLQSQENTTDTTNLGQIQFGTAIYGAGSVIPANDGTYLLKYTPIVDYVFLNWTTNGGVTVGNASSSTTNATINGNGIITAFYTAYSPPEPDLFQLDMNSSELEGGTPSLGNMTLNSTTYETLPNATSLTAGNYIIQYTPNDTYVFIGWEWTGDIIPWNSTAQNTTLTINGNGSITAIYATALPTTTSVTVVLQSMEVSSNSGNLGRIHLGDLVFALADVEPVVNGTYFLEYLPAEGYEFVKWNTTGDITVADPYSRVTNATIIGADFGILTAFFHGCDISVDSRQIENLALHEGVIMFDAMNHSLPANVRGIAAKDYTIQYLAPDASYMFLRWEVSANVIPMNSTSSSTTVRILGDGTLTAVYYVRPAATPQATVSLRSIEEGSVFSNQGSIRLGDMLFAPQNITTNVGTYLLEYVPLQGYTFISWTATEGITIENSTSAATNVTVNGNGTITATYSGCDVTLNSRHWENLSTNIGKINFTGTSYDLQYTVQGLAARDYSIQFVPENSSNVFLWWEFSGNIIPYDSTKSSTTLRVLGDGTLTAVYILKPSPPINASVNLNSKEVFSTTFGNLGTIQLGEIVYTLPNTWNNSTGTYLLEYTPAAGYVFINWTVTVNPGNIIIENSTAQSTTVTINGGGTITAFYRGCIVYLSSRHYANASDVNLGAITLGTTTYTLANVTNVPQADYFLNYTPPNSNYVFLWWEQSGNVMPWNFTGNPTTVTVYGDGNLTAVYALVTEPPPPYVGEWNTLYVDKGPILVPPFMWSLKSSHIPSWASTGADKQEVVVYSPPAPTIYLAQYVNITAYVGIDPAWNAKSIDISFGFIHNNQTYWLGNGSFPISSDGVYKMTIDSTLATYPGRLGEVPEGSVFVLHVVVTFYRQPWGTFKLYYGPNRPSRIELF